MIEIAEWKHEIDGNIYELRVEEMRMFMGCEILNC